MNGRRERINALIKKAEQNRADLASYELTIENVRARMEAIKANPLYGLLPEWLREAFEGLVP